MASADLNSTGISSLKPPAVLAGPSVNSSENEYLEMERIERPRDHSLERRISPPHTPRKAPDGLPIYSPSRNTSSPFVDTSEQPSESPGEEQPHSGIHEAIEKTNYWATLCFSSALIFTGVSSYYLYRAVKERKLSLLIPFAFWGVVATVIGTAGEIIQKTIKIEAPTVPHIIADPQEIPYQEGQPVGLQNAGNTCFVNSPTQAIMNSTAYPRVFKQICERGNIRHSAFKKFLELYPSPYSFLPWARLTKPKDKQGAQPFALDDENMRHILAMLSLKKSCLKYHLPEFKEKYTELYRVLGEFSQAKKETDYTTIKYDLATLNLQLSEMKKDPDILKFFYEQRTIIAKELLGFEAYLTLIKGYEKAVSEKKDFVVLQGWISSSIGNVRNLLQGAEGSSQEDVDEFLHCLAKYVLPEDYPEVFFTLRHQQLWAECPEQDPIIIARAKKKHDEAENSNDQLTQLDSQNNTISPPEPCCILKIQDPLTEGADGQKLIDNTLHSRNPINSKTEYTIFLNGEGKAKMFYPDRERFFIETPERIIIQLKRFEYTADGRTQKKNFSVNMPEEIQIKGQLYALKSVVVHSGYNIERGHYHALVKKKHPIANSEETEEKWWYTSDAYVKPAISADIKNALTKGYLYFYEKKKAVPNFLVDF